MTPTRFRERLEETRDRVDPNDVVTALTYVREEGRQR
ncbi:MAG: hypothetical protein ACI8UR_002133 [Natronomonas sp.]|jgi:hypothetical protein